MNGYKYNKLTIIEEGAGKRYGKQLYKTVIALCDCGNKTEVVLAKIKSGHTKSCGCLQKEANTKHGLSRTPEYKSFDNAYQRCNNPKDPNYYDYGGRGIKFLIKDIEELIDLIGRRPSKLHSLDRIDNSKHYEAGNIRWATRKEQQRNKRTNVTYKGECATDASFRLGGNTSLVTHRIRMGWSLEKAFKTKVK